MKSLLSAFIENLQKELNLTAKIVSVTIDVVDDHYVLDIEIEVPKANVH